jgi:ketosteroid isomerase-like protein
MKTAAVEAAVDADIRAAIGEWERAVRATDLEAIMAAYTTDVLAFDAIAALQFKGADAYRKHWETCLSFMQGPMIFEVHDLSITARDDVAFAHYLCWCGHTGEDGKEHAGFMRATVCLRQINGSWKIVHEHFSAPFDPESGKALFELEP